MHANAALNPQQGPYRQKAGLEEQHMCEPHTEIETAAAVAAAASSEDPLLHLLQLPQKGVLEMTLFNARDSFDNVLKGVRSCTSRLCIGSILCSQLHALFLKFLTSSSTCVF